MPYQPRATLDNPYGPQVTFRTEDVLPPTAVYLSPEDHVVVWVMTDVAVLTIYLTLRVLMPTGEIKLIPYYFSNPITYDWYPAFSAPPVEGYLLGAQCWAQNPQRGQCFVSVQLMRSAPPDLGAAGEVVLQGYINYLNVLTYPGSPIEWTFSGRGALLTITTPDVTGAPSQFNLGQYTLWRVQSLHCTLTTSATVITRSLFVYTNDQAGRQTGFWASPVQQTAGLSYSYNFSPAGASYASGNLVNIGAPVELLVPALGNVGFSCINLQPGDAFQGSLGLVEEWMGQ